VAESEKDTSSGPTGNSGKSFWSSLIPLVLSTGILGALFQQMQWSYQNAVTTKDQDATKLLDVEKTLSELIESRYFMTKSLLDELKRNQKSSDLMSEEKEFEESERKWLDNEPNLRGEIEYYVDAPSGKSTGSKRAVIQEKNPECTAFAFPKDQNLDPSSASDVLQVSTHCQELVVSDIRQAFEAKKGARAAPVDFKVNETRLDHLWWINDMLRCIVVQRAIDVRSSSPSWFLAGKSLGSSSGKRNCLRDYCIYQKCDALQAKP
jgi:hypothetical protein